jgi:3-dehydroquinate dehydratase
MSHIAEEVITGIGAKGYEEAMLKGILKYRGK